MKPHLKAVATKLAERLPVYRFLPPSGMRNQSAVRFHSRAGRQALVSYIRANGIPTYPISSAMIGARAAFRAGLDEQLHEALETLSTRFPEAPSPYELRSDLLAFHGDLENALRFAEQAQTLAPTSTSALARVVRLGYEVRGREEADEVMLTAVRRFPRSVDVLSAACRGVSTADQFRAILQLWEQQAGDRTRLPRVVRQLANGAMRGGELTTAIRLYQEAAILVASGQSKPRKIVDPTLAGRSAWRAIDDLAGALDGIRVGYFFAAGTALGLVREGRPLGSDDDIDVGILAADWDFDALTKLFESHPMFRVSRHPQASKLGLNHRAGSRIDIFRFYEEAGKLWHDGIFVRWQNSPFQIRSRSISGRELPLPADVERYLTENYGDWRTPNPAFDAFTSDAPNVHVTWPEYLRVHEFRKVYRRVVAGDLVTALSALERLGEEDFATKLKAASDAAAR